MNTSGRTPQVLKKYVRLCPVRELLLAFCRLSVLRLPSARSAGQSPETQTLQICPYDAITVLNSNLHARTLIHTVLCKESPFKCLVAHYSTINLIYIYIYTSASLEFELLLRSFGSSRLVSFRPISLTYVIRDLLHNYIYVRISLCLLSYFPLSLSISTPFFSAAKF